MRTQEKKKDLKYFVGQIYEDKYRRIEGKKWELFKSLNFISTNPLQVYGEKRPRLVRIRYELVKDKQKSLKEKTSYNIVRKECYELNNFDFKEEMEDEKKRAKKVAIRSHVVAENIKELYIEYVSQKQVKDKEKKTYKRDNNELSRGVDTT